MFDEDYINNTSQNIMRKSSCEGEETTKLYTIDPSLAKFIEDSITPSKKIEYDTKVAEFMVNILKELLSASKIQVLTTLDDEKLALIEVYEQNLWTILSKLEARKIASTGGSLMSTTLSGGFTMQTRHFKKEPDQKMININKTKSFLGTPSFSKKKKSLSSQKLIPFAQKKDVFDL